jgi:hypothetical protein
LYSTNNYLVFDGQDVTLHVHGGDRVIELDPAVACNFISGFRSAGLPDQMDAYVESALGRYFSGGIGGLVLRALNR